MSLASRKSPTSAGGARHGDEAAPVVLDVRVVCGAGGGPDKTILNSPRFLNSNGYRMLCAYMHPPGDPGFEVLEQHARSLGAPLLSVSDRGPWDWRVATRLLEICRRERVAIWHGHDYKSNALGLLLRRFWPMRLVTTVHGWVKQTWRTPLYYGIDRLCLPYYEKVICVSEDLYERCLEGGVPARRCILIENAIDTERFTRRLSIREAKDRLGLSPVRPVIGAIGRLSAEKGFDLLISAADRLLGMGFDLELHIAGEGDQGQILQRQITRLGREDRIRLLGYRADTVDLFQAMDVFVLSSLREGLPNVLLEAMAMEVPVVATRIAGVPRLVDHGRNGLLVDPGSAEDIAEAIARLLRDAGLRSHLGGEARETVKHLFNFKIRMENLSKLYCEILK